MFLEYGSKVLDRLLSQQTVPSAHPAVELLFLANSKTMSSTNWSMVLNLRSLLELSSLHQLPWQRLPGCNQLP